MGGGIEGRGGTGIDGFGGGTLRVGGVGAGEPSDLGTEGGFPRAGGMPSRWLQTNGLEQHK